MQSNPIKSSENYFFKKVVLLNFIFCVCVVVIHAAPVGRYGLELSNYPVMYAISLFCRAGVPSFYFISGLLFYKMTSGAEIKRKLKKRVRTLLIPYLIWNTLFLFIFYAMIHIPFIGDKMNMVNFELNISTVTRGIFLSAFSPLWFVKNLIVFVACAPLLYQIIKRKYLALGIFILLTGLSLFMHAPYQSLLWGIPVYLQGALMGYYFYSDKDNWHRDALRGRIPEKLRTPLILFLLIILLCTYIPMYYNEANMTMYRYISPIILWTLVDLTLNEFIETNFYIKMWMKCTFFIYCTHYFLLNIMQKLFVIYVEPSTTLFYFLMIATTLMTVGILIFTALKLNDNHLYKLMTGGR